MNDGISLLNIAQGAVQELSNIVIRQAELSEQALNGTYNPKQRVAMNAEANALVKEYNRIVATTSFNGLNTLAGVTNQLRMQLGYGTNGGIQVGVGNSLGFAAGSGSFAAEFDIEVGASFSELVAASDINGDGLLDLITTDSPSGSVFLSIGNGDGTFRAATSIASGISGIYMVKAADFNNDGIQDFYVSNGSGIGRLFTGNGNGTFRFGSSFTVSGYVDSTITGDFNGDGLLDIATSGGWHNARAFIQLGQGDGTFSAERSVNMGIGIVNDASFLESGDFNGDGITDLFCIDATAGNYGILILGNGNGTFSSPLSFATATGAASFSFTARDINGDGKADILYTNSVTGTLDVLLGNGNGTFNAVKSYASGYADLYAVKLADVNGDGNLDALVGDGSSSLGVMLGNGNGTFKVGITYGDITLSYYSNLGDLNNDGINDIIMATNGSEVALYLGNADSTGRRNNWLAELNLTTRAGAKAALVSSRATLTRINNELGSLGAMQSRLSVANQNLLVSRESFDSARSQLVDADVAQESATLVSVQIRQKAAAAVLSQANQQPALALRLLSTNRG